MAQVYVKYNPYRMDTEVEINGKSISNDSILNAVKGKRLQEWVGKFPQMLVEELHTLDFEIEFYGMALDRDDFVDAFTQAKKEGIIKNLRFSFMEGKSDDDITEKVVKVFRDLQGGPVKDFKDPRLIKTFNRINNDIFPINVIATMSSGKSTLINALLEKRLMPSKNQACTATITEILDNDMEQFTAVAYDKDNLFLQEISDLTYDVMNQLNDCPDVHRIAAEGNIPFLDAKKMALMLVDTPGPNNSRNQTHKEMTFRAINSDSNNLILYVLNATQLSTNDDAALLSSVAEQIKKGGKQVRDRFLFVLNKMDEFKPADGEDVGAAIQEAKKYLATYGIEDPQIFPCSAYMALIIRMYLKNVDITHLSLDEIEELPSAAGEVIPKIFKFIKYESLHLEQYTTLFPSAQKELEYKLNQAVKNGDKMEQALIHCGIYSIEFAIKAYVKKYAKSQKVKDLVESFYEVLKSTEVLERAKRQVDTDKEVAKACAERAAVIREKIADGKEAEDFRKRIADLNPMPIIEHKFDEAEAKATKKLRTLFGFYNDSDMITNREEAKRFVRQFTIVGSDYTASMATELEDIVNREVIETGNKILKEYQERLTRFDESVNNMKLNFGTADLIKGALKNMKAEVRAYNSEAFAEQTVDKVGHIGTKKVTKSVCVGQKPKEVQDGTEEVKIGTKRVMVGAHQEKVGTKKVKIGSHQEKVGTRKVENPRKKGVLGFFRFFESKYIEEDVYKTVPDYRDEDVYETVYEYKDEDVYKTKIKYKTIMENIYKTEEEEITTYSAEVSEIQSVLLRKVKADWKVGIKKTRDFAAAEVRKMKGQFTKKFDELDELVQQKYAELEQCAKDQKTREERLKKNQEILNWIEDNKKEIDGILDI